MAEKKAAKKTSNKKTSNKKTAKTKKAPRPVIKDGMPEVMPPRRKGWS